MKKTISMMMALAVAGTMAAPAMAVNDEPMVIAPAPNTQSQQAQMKIVVKGKTMPVQTISVNGCTMAPVRAIAEALGFKVTWNADRSININNGKMQSDLRIGDNSYVVYTAVEGMAGMSAPFELGSAPVIKNNTAYVPIDLFVPLFGNDPATVKTSGDTITINPDAKTEDGYAFEYSFGTIYADSPAMSIDTQLLSIVLTSAEEQGPRDIQVGDELSIVLEANYSENPSLRGSRESAVLYVLDLLPESMRWGEVKRDGQRVQTVEYAVHERVETDGEGYTDTGVIFTMEDNIVSAIRVYGLSARTTEAEISTVRDNLRFDALFDDYVQVPSSYNGAELPMFDGTDLQFSGIDFMSLTPESAADVLGDVIDDVWVENGTDGYVRTMTFAACDITFLYDAQKQNPQVEMLLIAADGMEGPRASRIGDTFAQVYNRFRNDNTAIDENDTEHLYGDEESGQYGVVEYTVDGTVMRFGLVLDDGVRVVLRLEFTASVLSEIMVYIE